MRYLEIWEVFRHEAVDLTDWQTSCFTVHQRHEDQGAAATQEACLARAVKLVFVVGAKSGKRRRSDTCMSKWAWETASARRPPAGFANIWSWRTGHYLDIVCLKPVKNN